jgi:anti-sigma28 factor (negative regulator of flagellin synthesis)
MDHRDHSSTDDPREPETADPPIDPQRLKKIEQLKQAIADGTYHISAEDVARKLMEHMLQPKLESND